MKPTKTAKTKQQTLNQNSGAICGGVVEAFSWKKFHKDLDIALAEWAFEVKDSSIHRELIEFLEFTNQKRLDEQRWGNK